MKRRSHPLALPLDYAWHSLLRRAERTHQPPDPSVPPEQRLPAGPPPGPRRPDRKPVPNIPIEVHERLAAQGDRVAIAELAAIREAAAKVKANPPGEEPS